MLATHNKLSLSASKKEMVLLCSSLLRRVKPILEPDINRLGRKGIGASRRPVNERNTGDKKGYMLSVGDHCSRRRLAVKCNDCSYSKSRYVSVQLAFRTYTTRNTYGHGRIPRDLDNSHIDV